MFYMREQICFEVLLNKDELLAELDMLAGLEGDPNGATD